MSSTMTRMFLPVFLIALEILVNRSANGSGCGSKVYLAVWSARASVPALAIP